MGKSTRDEIIEAADRLFYQHGYEHTSFSDIAAAVQISRGNFYFHFRSKDEILDAVIGLRLSNTRKMLELWEQNGAPPKERIRSFIDILIVNRAKIMRHGCPVGTLCGELAKLGHTSRKDANKLFTLFRDWLRGQFAQMGCGGDSDALALHVLARSQGVATLANAFHDEAFIRNEVRDLYGWLDACAARAAGKGPKRKSRAH